MKNSIPIKVETNLDQLLEANADKKNGWKKIIDELEKENKPKIE